MEKIKVLGFVELDDKGMTKDGEKYFDDNGGAPDGNFSQDEIAGKWLLMNVQGDIDIGDNVVYARRTIDDTLLIKTNALPFADFLSRLEELEKKASKCARAMAEAGQARRSLLDAREELTQYKTKIMREKFEEIVN